MVETGIFSILRFFLDLNPILQREWRVRWRDGRSLWLLGGLAFALNAWALADLNRPFDANETLPQRSHALFSNLMALQTLLALLITPALTATSIALERERGLLEALQLTSLRPTSLVLGKWSGALLFACFLWMMPLPLIALCFAFGGFEVTEWGDAAKLQLASLAAGAAIGLCCSAWSSRAAIALRVSYGITLFWGLSGFVALISLRWPRWHPTLREILTAFVQINPAIVSLSFNNLPLKTSFDMAARNNWGGWFSTIGLCVSFALLLSAALLLAATFAVQRPLDEAVWWEIKRRKSQKAATKNSSPQTVSTMRDAAPASVIERFTNFKNPVLMHEARGKLRMRQPPKAVIIIELLMATGVGLIYFALLFAAWFQPTGSFLSRFLGGASGFELGLRETIWRVLPWVTFLVMVPAGALMGATSIVRERESGSWETLKLSLLTPGEILWGKIGGALWICAVFTLPLWPLLLPGIQAVEYQIFLGDASNPHNGVPLTLALSEIAIIIATVFGATTLGLWIAWPAQRSDLAGGRVLAILVLLLGAPPMFASQMPFLHLNWWHPGWVLWTLEQDYRTQAIGGKVAPVVIIWLVLGCLCWAASWWRLSLEMRRRKAA